MKIEQFDEQSGYIQLSLELSELKRIYKALFTQLKAPEGSLKDEGDLALNLQMFLQRHAFKSGVDVTRHSEWEKWLGDPNPTPCEVRYADRLKK